MEVTGIIYWGTIGNGTPTFWTGVQEEKVKNLMSPAVNIGELRKLNYWYNKTVFRPGLFQSDGQGISPPHYPRLVSAPKGTSFSFWIGTPTF